MEPIIAVPEDDSDGSVGTTELDWSQQSQQPASPGARPEPGVQPGLQPRPDPGLKRSRSRSPILPLATPQHVPLARPWHIRSLVQVWRGAPHSPGPNSAVLYDWAEDALISQYATHSFAEGVVWSCMCAGAAAVPSMVRRLLIPRVVRFYIGATRDVVRRSLLVPESGGLTHAQRYERVLVLFQGASSEVAALETELIGSWAGDPRCANKEGTGGEGIARGPLARGLTYSLYLATSTAVRHSPGAVPHSPGAAPRSSALPRPRPGRSRNCRSVSCSLRGYCSC